MSKARNVLLETQPLDPGLAKLHLGVHFGTDSTTVTVHKHNDWHKDLGEEIARGTATVSDKDTPNETIGFAIAAGRALIAAGEQLRDYGWRLDEIRGDH